MELQELRDELITYIQIADEQKLEALHTLLLKGQAGDELQWWKDEAFVAELNERVRRFESGEDKGYTEEEAFSKFWKTIEKHRRAHV